MFPTWVEILFCGKIRQPLQYITLRRGVMGRLKTTKKLHSCHAIWLKSNLGKLGHYVLKSSSENSQIYFLFWWQFMSPNEISASKMLEAIVIWQIPRIPKMWSEHNVEKSVVRSWTDFFYSERKKLLPVALTKNSLFPSENN